VNLGGKEMLPFQYQELKYIYSKEPTFVSTNEDKTQTYFTLSKKILEVPAVTNKEYNPYSVRCLDNGNYLVSRYDPNQSSVKNHLLASSGAYLRALPDGNFDSPSFSSPFEQKKYKHLLKLSNRNLVYYVNLENGVVYLEQ
jgi:hypothetical protein